MKKLIVIFFLFSATASFSQRLVPNAFRWSNSIGVSAGAGYGNLIRLKNSPELTSSKPDMWFGGALKGEYQINMYRRFEFGMGFWLRKNDFTEQVPPVNELETRKIELSMLNFAVKYKLYQHVRTYSVYFAPGVIMDIELNHPILRANSSGVGIIGTLGTEKRLGRKSIFFMEVDARLTSLLHFNKEDYPWRHAGICVNIGFSRVL